MDYTELITVVLGSNIAQSITQYFITRKAESRNDFTEIIQTWSEDNKRLREEKDTMQKKVHILEKKIFELSHKITLLEQQLNINK